LVKFFIDITWCDFLLFSVFIFGFKMIELDKIWDIDWYDGPIACLGKDKENNLYYAKWVDSANVTFNDLEYEGRVFCMVPFEFNGKPVDDKELFEQADHYFTFVECDWQDPQGPFYEKIPKKWIAEMPFMITEKDIEKEDENGW